MRHKEALLWVDSRRIQRGEKVNHNDVSRDSSKSRPGSFTAAHLHLPSDPSLLMVQLCISDSEMPW